MNTNLPPAGWFLDPAGLADGRYWDGAVWTAATTRAGVTITVPIDPTHAAIPPLPGTAILPPVNVSSTASSNDRSAVAVGIGVMIAALVVFLGIAIASNSDSDDSPPPPGTEPAATEQPADE